MKLKYFILSSSLFANLALAKATLILTNMNTNDGTSLTLQIQDANTIKDVKYVGLDNFQVLGREVSINNSSTKTPKNTFSNKLILMPTKAESTTVSVTANVDGKTITSNTVNFVITKEQLAQLQQKQKQQQLANKKYMQEMQKNINEQFKAQQKLFRDMDKAMQKQFDDIQKMQQKMFNN